MKLVTTQASTGKPTTIITSSNPGATPSTILGISSVQPQVSNAYLMLILFSLNS